MPRAIPCCPKLVLGRRLPVGTVEEGVQLDNGQAQGCPNLAGDSALPGARRSIDDDASPDAASVSGHWRRRLVGAGETIILSMQG